MREAAITPDELGLLIIHLEKLLKEFAEAALFNTVILPFAGQTLRATREVMQALAPRSTLED
jgi:hypothetical protein